MFILHRIVFIFNTIAILALLASYLAPYIPPVLSWQIAFLGLAYPAIFLVNVLFIIYWAIFLNLKFMFSLAAIIIGWSFVPRFVQFNQINSPATSENCLRVVSFNTRYFGYLDDYQSADDDNFFDKLSKINPDILCVQEMINGMLMKNNVSSHFQKIYKNFHLGNVNVVKGKWSIDNLAIISRYPIIKQGVVERDPSTFNYTIYADIVKDQDTIRVISTHLQSIRFEKKEYEAVENLETKMDSVDLTEYRSIASKIKLAFMMRTRQVDAIRDFIDKSPYKIIMCGDFNDSPTSYAYRTIRGKFKDSFMEAGSGLGRTYVGKMPSLRIDYILGDESFGFYNYYAKAFDFSDHKMISCTIKIK